MTKKEMIRKYLTLNTELTHLWEEHESETETWLVTRAKQLEKEMNAITRELGFAPDEWGYY